MRTTHFIRLVGAPSIATEDGSEKRLPFVDAALLALLALDGPQERDAAATLLWPVPDATARANLRQRLFRLRRDFGEIVSAERNRLSLADGAHHDLMDASERWRSDPGALAGELLGQARALTPAFADWLHRSRERFRAHRAAVLAEVAEGLENQRRFEDALPYAVHLARHEPLVESAQRRLMRLYYLLSDRGAALTTYERFAANLRRELGVSPADETLDLLRVIHTSATAVAPVGQPVKATSSAAQGSVQSAVVLRPPRLVRREVELRDVARAFEAGRSVLVIGEAGIGKSRLMEEFADRHSLQVRISARPGDAGVPYSLAARILRALPAPRDKIQPWVRSELARLDPSLGQAPIAAVLPLRLLQAFNELFRLVPDQQSMLLDDLHFADAATLELLPALAAPPRKLLLGVRAGEQTAPLKEWLSDASDRVSRVELVALDPGGVHDLIATLNLPTMDANEWAPALSRHTGGHPLLILETLRALIQEGAGGTPPAKLPVPREVRALIQRRLDQLSEQAIRLAQTAALAMPNFSAHVAIEVLGLDELSLAAPWRELQESVVMAGDTFVHDIVLECTRDSVPAPLAKALRGRIAAALSKRGDSPARVAEHWEAAGEMALAAQSHEAAADAAHAASQSQAEHDHRARAVACYERVGSTDRAFLARVQQIRALNESGRADEGNVLVSSLEERARSISDRAWVSCLRAQSMAVLTNWSESLDAANHALQLCADGHAALNPALLCDAFPTQPPRSRSWDAPARRWNDSRRPRSSVMPLAIDNVSFRSSPCKRTCSIALVTSGKPRHACNELSRLPRSWVNSSS